MTMAATKLSAMPRVALLDKPLASSLIALSLPSVVAMVLQTSVSIMEIWSVSHISLSALAGLTLVYPLHMLMVTLSAGAFGGMTAGAIARAIGTEDRAGAEKAAWNGLFLAVLMGLTMSALFLPSINFIFTWLGGRDLVLEQAMSYGSLLFSGVGLIWIFNSLMAILRGGGQMKQSALITLAVVVLQIPLIAVFTFGWGPIEALGIRGIAAALMLAFTMGIFMAIYLLLKPDAPVRLSRTACLFDNQLFWRSLKSSLVAGFSPLLTVFSVVLLTKYVSSFGDAALAGYGIGSRIEFLLIPLVFGIGTALTTLVGLNIGAGRLSRAIQVAWMGSGAAAFLASVIGVGFALFPWAWADLFNEDLAVLSAAYRYLSIAGWGYAFVAAGLALYFASQGANRVIWPLIAAVSRIVVVVGGASWVLAQEQPQLDDLFKTILVSMIIFGGINIVAIRFGAWSPRTQTHGVIQ